MFLVTFVVGEADACNGNTEQGGWYVNKLQ